MSSGWCLVCGFGSGRRSQTGSGCSAPLRRQARRAERHPGLAANTQPVWLGLLTLLVNAKLISLGLHAPLSSAFSFFDNHGLISVVACRRVVAAASAEYGGARDQYRGAATAGPAGSCHPSRGDWPVLPYTLSLTPALVLITAPALAVVLANFPALILAVGVAWFHSSGSPVLPGTAVRVRGTPSAAL